MRQRAGTRVTVDRQSVRIVVRDGVGKRQLHGGQRGVTVEGSGHDARSSDVVRPDGAAAVYGPQKGASPDDVRNLDAALAHWADLVDAATGRTDVRDRAGAGAAGGVGYAAMAVLGAELEPGIGLVLDLVHFADHLPGADLVITGEGSLDEQTLQGKIVGEIGTRTRQAGVPLHAVVGRDALDAFGKRIIDLQVVQEAGTAEELEAAGERLGRLLAEGKA